MTICSSIFGSRRIWLSSLFVLWRMFCPVWGDLWRSPRFFCLFGVFCGFYYFFNKNLSVKICFAEKRASTFVVDMAHKAISQSLSKPVFKLVFRWRKGRSDFTTAFSGCHLPKGLKTKYHEKFVHPLSAPKVFGKALWCFDEPASFSESVPPRSLFRWLIFFPFWCKRVFASLGLTCFQGLLAF